MKAFPQKIGVVVILFLPVLQQQYFANQILGYNVFKKGSIPVDLYCVQTKNEFLKALSSVRGNTRVTTDNPEETNTAL